MRHNSVRHNDPVTVRKGGGARPVFSRTVIMIALLFGVLFFSADAGLSQAHRPARKTEKKSTEQKKKEPRQGKEKKAEESISKEESPGDVTSDALQGDAKKGEEKKAAEGDLNMRDYGEDDFRPRVEEESTAWLFFKTIFVLGSIVGGFYFFFKFVTKKTGIQMLGQDVVKVLSVVPLGQNKFIQVVDLAGKILVLGITDNSISVLSEVMERDEIDRIRILSSKTMTQKVEGFQDFLTVQIGKVVSKVSGFRQRGAPTATVIEEEQVAGDIDYLRSHRKRLRDLNGADGENE